MNYFFGKKMRGINQRFINDLNEGELSFFLQQVKERRDELALEIRDDYINIYYLGGNLLKITQKRNGYLFYFDPRYCLNKGDDSNCEQISKLDSFSASDYADNFGLLINEISTWLKKHPKNEREYQHNLLLNNASIVDIEYQVKRDMRFDMLLVTGDRLVIVENKYGPNAISGKAGLSEHYTDICNVLNDEELKKDLYGSVLSIADCKYKLDLRKEHILQLNPENPEILFLLGNYDRKSQAAQTEMSRIEITVPVKLLFMSADEYVIDMSKAVEIGSTEE